MCIAMSLGSNGFKEFLSGARVVDNHFRSADLKNNIPVLLALLGHWNQNGLGFRSHAVLPYAEDLSGFLHISTSGHGEQRKFVGRDRNPT